MVFASAVFASAVFASAVFASAVFLLCHHINSVNQGMPVVSLVCKTFISKPFPVGEWIGLKMLT